MSQLFSIFGGGESESPHNEAAAPSESPEAFKLPAGFLEGQAHRARRGSLVSELGDGISVMNVADTNELILEIQRLHSDQRLTQAARVLHKLRVGLERATAEHPENEDLKAAVSYTHLTLPTIYSV
eukprot:TRINITY_DN2643_c0_g1_i1.p1 TRINITY_DN2643_c0_g1~~TRINITY_DN2643_c0_g1_i1.p1  ORF type:complete len:126 (-),score=36.31 TRINITY_DN2643_c0_g1_i1:52-429(-)